jgi:hypothetical protein
LRFAAVHDALKEAVSPAFVNTWMELAEEPAKPIAAIAPEPQSNVLPMNERPELPESESQSELPEVEGSSEQSGLVSSLEVVAEPSLKLSLEPGLKPFLESCQKFLKISMEHLPAEFAEAVRPQSTSPGATATGADAPENAAETRDPEDLDIDLRLNSATLARAARQLPRLIPESSTAWPAAARPLVPGSTKGIEARQAWTRIAAWVVLRSLASKGKRTAAFDQLHLRFALAEIFSSTGLAGEGGWWAAAQVRLLLRQADRTSSSLDTEAFWNDPDVRWLAGVNESDGIVYFNRERFEEMVCWLQLPELFRIAATVPVDLAGLQLLETTVAEVCLSAERSSYQLKQFLTAMSPDTLEGRTTSASKS